MNFIFIKRKGALMKTKMKCICYLVLGLLFTVPHALAGNGSCDCKRFNLPESGDVNFTWTVKIKADDVPLFETSTDTNPKEKLKFNQNFNIVKADGVRLQVQRHEDMTPYGWVERKNLLCALKPIKSKSGLDKKFYIKTATRVRSDKPATVKAYARPDSDICGSGGCRELARFDGYFIFDESDGRYLLADAYKLRPENRLVGWVDADDGFIWDTAYGLRPKENLVFPKDNPKAGQERVVYAYLSEEEAIKRHNGRPILGGERWYKYALRIPILSRQKNLFKVVMPLAGVGVSQSDKFGRIVISDQRRKSTEKAIQNILNIKNVDVFFLIDGTRSIEPYLKSIKSVVTQLKTRISENPELGVITSRLGFGVYRDKYAEETELGYWHSFPEKCGMDKASIEENHKRFMDEMDMIIQAMLNYRIKGDRNFEENTFGGIQKFVENELSNCPDRLKILFVIGDHGYSAKNQKKLYDRKPVSESSLVNGLRGDQANGVMPVITYFIQTPYSQEQTAHLSKAAYKKAYKLFSKQAKSILTQLKKQTPKMELDRYLLQSDDKKIAQKVINGLSAFINPKAVSAVNEVILDLRGGASLAETIERWQGYNDFNNLPGLFWDLIANAGCKYLGDQCSSRIMDTILEGYIPISNDVVVDIWCTAEDLKKYRNIIEGILDSSEYQHGKFIRTELVYGLISTLQRLVPSPPPPETGETLIEYVRRISYLPIRQDSPLFRYSIQELEDRTKVPDCEIERLFSWIGNVNNFLYYIADNKRPVYDVRKQPGSCASGNEIPYIVPGSILGKHFSDSNMSYSHPLGGTTIYWIPKKYLP
ncbi:conserved hypothetical protein, secreted [Candidatus Magnetomorum sp. HK-1]|nr:conserved hypothetical protein, secreted [Candidatus Magnetomorum sp. HK-1]